MITIFRIKCKASTRWMKSICISFVFNPIRTIKVAEELSYRDHYEHAQS